jgi:hypothetical protein
MCCLLRVDDAIVDDLMVVAGGVVSTSDGGEVREPLACCHLVLNLTGRGKRSQTESP